MLEECETMSSDLIFAQLATPSFSSGSSFGNPSISATAQQPGYAAGNHDMIGSESGFESTLQVVSDSIPTSDVLLSSGEGQTASQEVPQTDNLLGVSHNHPSMIEDGALDPNLSVGMNTLIAVLNDLQKAVMLNHSSGPGAGDPIAMVPASPGSPADPVSMGTGISGHLRQALEALLKQFDNLGQNQNTIEIRNLIKQFDVVSGGGPAKLVKTTEMAGLFQNLTALLSNAAGQGDLSILAAGPINLSQTGNSVPGEKPMAADLDRVLTAITASLTGSSERNAQQGTSDYTNLEKDALAERALTRAAVFATPKTVSTGENASTPLRAGAQTLSSMSEVNEIKNPMPGQKDIFGLQPNKAPDGGLKHHNPGPLLQANSTVQPNDNALQSGKAVHLRTDGSVTEALAGKMVNTESGNQENGFTFTGQQQNEIKASVRPYVTEEPQMVQKKFQAQTLDQIVQKAALNLKNGQNEVQIHLKPDFLGQIRMQIITDSQQVTVRIFAEFPAVKELIENNAHLLRSELQNHGLDIDELEVSVSQHSDQQVADQNRADGSAGRSGTEKKVAIEDGESENSTVSSRPSHVRDADEITKIDFFA
jgi:flagellar hook-length control protein FliK